jgi:PAS domain S-box-containing protein
MSVVRARPGPEIRADVWRLAGPDLMPSGIAASEPEPRAASGAPPERSGTESNVSDLVWMMDNNLNVRYISPFPARLTGLPTPEMMNHALQDALSPATYEQTLALLHEQLEAERQGQGDPFRARNIEIANKRRDGSTFWVEVRVWGLRDFNSRLDGFLGISRDITGRKLAEQRLQALLQGAPDAVLYQTGGGTDYFSPNARELLGLTAEELGRDRSRFSERIHTEDQPRVAAAHAEWRCQGAVGVLETEFRFQRPDRTELWLLERTRAAFRTPAGQLSVIGVLTDITARKRTDEELARLRRGLEDMVRTGSAELETTRRELARRDKLALLGEIAGSIARELRGPLQAIEGEAALIRTTGNGRLPDRVDAGIQAIEEQSARAGAAITALLDVAQDRPAEPRRVRINKLIFDALSGLRIPSGIRVERVEPAPAPDVLVDPNQIAVALKSLLRNAVQAMGEKGRLAIEVRSDAGFVSVIVRDTGTCIPADTIDLLFDPLAAAGTTGNGLGLVICRNFVERNGGTVEVRSAPGQGSTFTIRLPGA